MKNRVILFGPWAPPYGGVATFMENIFFRLSTSFENVTFLAFSRGKIVTRKVIQMRSKPWYLFQIVKYLSTARICLDSVEFCIEYPNWKLASFWWIIKHLYQFKWIKFIHDGSLPARFSLFTDIEKLVFFRMIKQVDQLVVMGDMLGNWFRDEINYNGEILTITPLLPEIDTEKSPSPPENIVRFIGVHDKTLVSIGVFDKSYGFIDVIQATQTIRDQYKMNIGVVLIDCGFTNNKEYENEVIGSRDWVLRISQIPHHMMRLIIKNCDALVRATEYDSFGLSRIEGILSKKPVIATNTGETRGMFLYSFGDQAMLKIQLEKVLFHQPNNDQDEWINYYKCLAQENYLIIEKLIMG